MAQQTKDANAVVQISKDDCLKKAVSLDNVITEHVMMADDEDLPPPLIAGVITRNLIDYLCSKTEGNTPLVARTILRQITSRLERYVPDEYFTGGHQVVTIEVNWDPDGDGRVETYALLRSATDTLNSFVDCADTKGAHPIIQTYH